MQHVIGDLRHTGMARSVTELLVHLLELCFGTLALGDITSDGDDLIPQQRHQTNFVVRLQPFVVLRVLYADHRLFVDYPSQNLREPITGIFEPTVLETLPHQLLMRHLAARPRLYGEDRTFVVEAEYQIGNRLEDRPDFRISLEQLLRAHF